jgi:REP-associated tyrosine transposase
VPRKRRLFLPKIPVHALQRGNNRQAIFFEAEDYRLYLSLLTEACGRYGCAIHTYVLMTNHVHLLVTPETRDSISKAVQYVGRRYVPAFNKKYERTGTLWEGRFKASTIESKRYLLACYRYIEMNPVRAGMVVNPIDYPWSGSRSNALGQADEVITAHGEYLALGQTASDRRCAYRLLFDKVSCDGEWDDVRSHLQSGTPMGNHKFKGEIEKALGGTVGYSRPGRPQKRL